MTQSPLEYCNSLLDNTPVSGMVDFDYYQLAECRDDFHLDPVSWIRCLDVIQA